MDLLTGNIRRLYTRYLAAAFGSALISSIYGMVDMAMVGQYQGPDGAAALAVVAPVWNIIYSLGLLTGIASVIITSRVNAGNASVGVNFEFEAIIGSVLGGTSMAGGIGNVAMSIVGIYVVGIINNVMNLCSVNAFWQQVVKGIVILVAVLLDIFTRNAIMKSTKKR